MAANKKKSISNNNNNDATSSSSSAMRELKDTIKTQAAEIDRLRNELLQAKKGGGGGIPGVDTTQFDQMFINVASFILPAWGIIVGTIFVFGTIAKVAFPEKYDEMTTKAEKESFKGQIDLDNLSEDDLAAVAELEAEMKAKGKM